MLLALHAPTALVDFPRGTVADFAVVRVRVQKNLAYACIMIVVCVCVFVCFFAFCFCLLFVFFVFCLFLFFSFRSLFFCLLLLFLLGRAIGERDAERGHRTVYALCRACANGTAQTRASAATSKGKFHAYMWIFCAHRNDSGIRDTIMKFPISLGDKSISLREISVN